MDNTRQTCPQCNGKGSAYIEHGNHFKLERCPLCRGTGAAKISHVYHWYIEAIDKRHKRKDDVETD